jgi:hypothetical protein
MDVGLSGQILQAAAAMWIRCLDLRGSILMAVSRAITILGS